MSRTLHVKTRLGPTESPSAVYGRMAEAVPADVMLVLGPGIWRELRRELQSVSAVGQWVVELAVRLDRVILLNVPDRDGGSCTLTLSPPGWSQERLAGYIAGRHSELEEAFGPIARVRGAA
jgi:hypothetical protein